MQVPLLILGCAALVGWIWALPPQLGGADDLADKYVRQGVRVRLAQAAARERLSARELDTRAEQWIAGNRNAFDKERAAAAARFRDALRYRGSDGRDYTYLGDQDSYTWLRLARNYLQHGTTCDAVVAGECRDTFVNAPLGAKMIYNRSLHVAAIVGLQRLITLFHPDYPLPATAFWVPVLIAMLSVVPAFLIGYRLAGVLGGIGVALLVPLNRVVLLRSLGSDNDVWNIFLPLCMNAAAMAALSADGVRRQVAWSVVAAVFATLHATTWNGWIFAYAVLLAALVANLVLQLIGASAPPPRKVARRREAPPQPHPGLWAPAVQRAAVVLGIVFTATGILLLFVASDQSYLPLARRQLGIAAPDTENAPGVGDVGVWPDVLATVNELQPTDLGAIVADMPARPFLFVALFGALLLLLPRRVLGRAEIAIAAGAALLYAWLASQSSVGQLATLFIAALPLVVAALLSAVRGTTEDRVAMGPALIAVVWWLTGLFAAFRGARFLLLFAPGAGIAMAAAVGLAHKHLTALAARAGSRYASALAAAIAMILAAAYVVPIPGAYHIAHDYLPTIDDSWWDTLTNLRQKAAPDAIVDVWWDYGYWAKYIAERRVATDGATLLTHLPYWLGRVLVSASEQESVGLLRMMSCGSDATPLPEGRQSAYGKIHAKLNDAVKAQSMVIDLASRDREAAAAYLGEHGFSPAEQQDVLAATHCDPPETYLVIGTDLTRKDSWMRLAAWDFRRAYIAHEAAHRPQAELVADVVQRFGFSTPEATSLYEQARRLPRNDFIIGPAPRAPSVWYPCVPGSEPSIMHCRLGLLDINANKLLEEFVFNILAPQQSHFRYRHAEPGQPPGPPLDLPPGALIVAEHALNDVDLPEPRYNETGVLFDTQKWRILVGPPPLIRSTFTHLLFLDGRYAKHYEKFDERQSYTEDRLVTWRVRF
jgi:hypothetical protein